MAHRFGNISSQHEGNLLHLLPTWTKGEQRKEAGTVTKWEGLLCWKHQLQRRLLWVSWSRIFSLSRCRVMKLWTNRKVVHIECYIVKGAGTVVAVLVMNGYIVALRLLIVAAKSERWYDAALTAVTCNRRLCVSGWGLLSLPSLPSFPNCKLIIFFRFTTPSTAAPAELRRASCQMLTWVWFIWKSTCNVRWDTDWPQTL